MNSLPSMLFSLDWDFWWFGGVVFIFLPSCVSEWIKEWQTQTSHSDLKQWENQIWKHLISSPNSPLNNKSWIGRQSKYKSTHIEMVTQKVIKCCRFWTPFSPKSSEISSYYPFSSSHDAHSVRRRQVVKEGYDGSVGKNQWRWCRLILLQGRSHRYQVAWVVSKGGS